MPFILNGGAEVASCLNLLTFFCLQCSRGAHSRWLRVVSTAQRSSQVRKQSTLLSRRFLWTQWYFLDVFIVIVSVYLWHVRVCEIVVCDRLFSVPRQGSDQPSLVLIWNGHFFWFKYVYIYATFFSKSSSFHNVRFFSTKCADRKRNDVRTCKHVAVELWDPFVLERSFFVVVIVDNRLYPCNFFLAFYTLAAQFSMNERGCACVKPCWIL